MGLEHSPSIVTNGLVFCIDSANSKSWKGAPTTNYIPYPYASYDNVTTNNFVFGYNYDQTASSAYFLRTDVPNPIGSPYILEYYTGTTGYKYFSIDSTTLPTTGTYNFSYYARIVSGATSSGLGLSQLWRAGGVDQSVTGDWNPTLSTDWKRYSTQGPVNSGTILQYFPVHGGAITGGINVQYCGFQLELSSFAKAFAVGTRSNTQSVLDLTNRVTVTANSLTYGANNIFTYNGTSDYVSVADNDLLNLTNITMEAWVRFNNSASGSRIIFLGKGDGANHPTTEYWLEKTASDVFSVYISVGVLNSGGVNFYTNFTISPNTWYHLVGTFDGSVVRGYVNGVENSSSYSLPGSIPNTAFQYSVGRMGSYNGLYHNGDIAVNRLYNRALTAAEVTQNFNALRRRFGL